MKKRFIQYTLYIYLQPLGKKKKTKQSEQALGAHQSKGFFKLFKFKEKRQYFKKNIIEIDLYGVNFIPIQLVSTK